jgi:hypothetical protein
MNGSAEVGGDRVVHRLELLEVASAQDHARAESRALTRQGAAESAAAPVTRMTRPVSADGGGR